MPIKSYKCRECGKEFSKIFFTLENAPRECPVCGASNPEDLGSTFQADEQTAQRVMRGSCDACGDEDCCTSAGSS